MTSSGPQNSTSWSPTMLPPRTACLLYTSCKYCLLCVADTVVKMTKAAQKEYPGLAVVCAGGVMSLSLIHI